MREMKKESKWEIILLFRERILALQGASPAKSCAPCKRLDKHMFRYRWRGTENTGKASKGRPVKTTPEYFVNVLAAPGSPGNLSDAFLVNLKMSLTNEPTSWTFGFLNAGGLDQLAAAVLSIAQRESKWVPMGSSEPRARGERAKGAAFIFESFIHLLANPRILNHIAQSIYHERRYAPHHGHDHTLGTTGPFERIDPHVRPRIPSSHIAEVSAVESGPLVPPLANRHAAVDLFCRVIEAGVVLAEAREEEGEAEEDGKGREEEGEEEGEEGERGGEGQGTEECEGEGKGKGQEEETEKVEGKEKGDDITGGCEDEAVESGNCEEGLENVGSTGECPATGSCEDIRRRDPRDGRRVSRGGLADDAASQAWRCVADALDPASWEINRADPSFVVAAPADKPTGVQSPTAFQLWMTEVRAVASERMKVWNGSAKRASEIFNMLADGTYRWQPIVQAHPTCISDRVISDYLAANVKLATLIIAHAGDLEARFAVRARLGIDDLKHILALSANPRMIRSLRAFQERELADLTAGLDPETGTIGLDATEGATAGTGMSAMSTEEQHAEGHDDDGWQSSSPSAASGSQPKKAEDGEAGRRAAAAQEIPDVPRRSVGGYESAPPAADGALGGASGDDEVASLWNAPEVHGKLSSPDARG
ncbi:hypothetical protein BDK51DRAFT_52726 [Blyttiomyces helicus]|uniref:Uncharacterized protein n=1 Tax=Blyttiomyces helicus TaxID=388810 RepID=A0A4P9WE33_9FUNG|nr:hypothetical protein BDK51DRAFT_52726 [Blyttiomyces helicus]|eukprot:RKO89230.1 hypothetical protein BDK51DRAFT_52726 [Blyttiomyces helicus]